MKTIEELTKQTLGSDNLLALRLSKAEIRPFLHYAKQNGCVWVSGKQIDEEHDLLDAPYAFICIEANKTISKLSAMCWCKSTNLIKIEFKDLFEVGCKHLETSESVNIGHPDKTCDTIADAFLDEALKQDKFSQMAVECAIKNNKLFVYGEATTNAKIDYVKIAKNILKQIGYTCDFDVIIEVSTQSPDINQAVNRTKLCANDQGICYGYATNETKQYMPLPILIAHKLMQQYETFRQTHNQFFADAKSQVTVEYIDNTPIRIDTILISVSHSEDLTTTEIQQIIKQQVVDVALKEFEQYLSDTKFIINPSGKFTIWGSFGDSGCVGRKIVVDTYGGVGRVGGGCFSSKNATKVDRSGAYYARYVAKNIVAHNLADKCEVELCFGIGLSKPLAININTFGTEKVDISLIYDYVNKNFNFELDNIIKELDLLKPIYQNTACFGHFGREEFSWEKIKD